MQRVASEGLVLTTLRALGRSLARLPRALALVPVLLWMGLIRWLSSLPAGEGLPSWIGGYVTNLAHAPLFGLLALWAALVLPRAGGWPRLGPRHVAAVLGFVLLYAVLDELHQASSPGRHPSPYDVLTDLVGAACVLWIAAYLDAGAATERGLIWRLLLGVAFCLAAALLATYEPLIGPPLGSAGP